MTDGTGLLLVVVGISELIALGCLRRLWRTEPSPVRRWGWSIVVVVPVLGPVFFGALWDAPDGDDGFPPPPALHTDATIDHQHTWP